MLVVGLGLLAVPATSEIGKWLAIAGAVIILLMAGREKTKNLQNAWCQALARSTM